MSSDFDNTGRTPEESARIESLESYEVLDTPAEKIFDEFAHLAAEIGETPTALISLVDGTRQWFKARVGLLAEETPRNIAFCAHAIECDDVFVVPDASLDPRFAENPLVTGAPSIRFYAGAPLITLDGHALGTVCVIDYVPREFSLEKQEALQALSRQVMAQLELRRRLFRFSLGGGRASQIVDSIQRALQSNEFVLDYQPVVDARSGRIVELEALLRWNDPRRGRLLPAEFLPAMEESGLIVNVGEWVLQRACDDSVEWTIAPGAPGIPRPLERRPGEGRSR
jgi:GAF domain-containing protein